MIFLKNCFLKQHYFCKQTIIHPTDHIQGKIMMILIKVSKNRNGFLKTLFLPKSNAIILRISAILYFCKKLPKFFILKKANTKPGTDVILGIDFRSRLML